MVSLWQLKPCDHEKETVLINPKTVNSAMSCLTHFGVVLVCALVKMDDLMDDLL